MRTGLRSDAASPSQSLADRPHPPPWISDELGDPPRGSPLERQVGDPLDLPADPTGMARSRALSRSASKRPPCQVTWSISTRPLDRRIGPVGMDRGCRSGGGVRKLSNKWADPRRSNASSTWSSRPRDLQAAARAVGSTTPDSLEPDRVGHVRRDRLTPEGARSNGDRGPLGQPARNAHRRGRGHSRTTCAAGWRLESRRWRSTTSSLSRRFVRSSDPTAWRSASVSGRRARSAQFGRRDGTARDDLLRFR